MKFVFFLAFSLPLIGFSQVDFSWVSSIDDDFSFTEEWDYVEGIYINQWGQLSCDGFCPMEIDALKDEQGRIYDDSLTKFYSIIDTTHYYFTHQGTVRAYEFGECNYAYVTEVDGIIYLETEVNIATHTSLQIEFFPDPGSKIPFRAYLYYNSIGNMRPKNYDVTHGTVEISSEAIRNGFIQMRFDLEFELDENDTEPQTWKGKIIVELPE